MATCIGVFHDRASADAAIDELRALGLGANDVSVVLQGREGVEKFRGWDDGGNYRTDDVSAGEGAAVGGLTGLLLGAGLMLIPGIGPVFAVGPLAAGLAGAVAGGVTGAVTGGIAGGLIDLGVPEEDARYYERRIGEGSYLVTANCHGRDDEVRDIMRRHGAEDVQGRGFHYDQPVVGDGGSATTFTTR